MEINRSNIMEIVNKTSIKPSKDYGQNFLIEPSISARIVDALKINNGDRVLEIGPGLGSLTHFLCLSNEQITAVDIDNKMTNFLKIVYQNQSNLIITENDIRKENISSFNKIIGNIPYNITTEIIQHFLINSKQAKTMVFMIQAEALNRFIDISGKEYGPLSVLIHLLGSIEKLFIVKAGSFYPAPKCHSVVFRINVDENANREKAIAVYKMCKLLFANRRKTIQNNLVSILKNKEDVLTLCKELNINPLERPEDLSPTTYKTIYDYLNK